MPTRNAREFFDKVIDDHNYSNDIPVTAEQLAPLYEQWHRVVHHIGVLPTLAALYADDETIVSIYKNDTVLIGISADGSPMHVSCTAPGVDVGNSFRLNSDLYAAVGNVRNWLADDGKPYMTPIGMPRGTPEVFQDQYAGGGVEQYGPYLGETHLGWFTVDELLTSFDRNLTHFRGEMPATPVTYAEVLPDFHAFLKRMRQAHPHGDLVLLFGFDQG